MNAVTFKTASDDETLALGRRIGERLPDGCTVALVGPLGAGKTWLSKGLVRGIGEIGEELVKSPAFNLVHEYYVSRGGREIPIFHMDFYRLDELNETDAVLFAEYFESPGSICLVEWADKFVDQLADAYLQITIAVGDAAEERTITVAAVGPTEAFDALLRGLRNENENTSP